MNVSQINKEKPKDVNVWPVDLETLGNWPLMPKILTDICKLAVFTNNIQVEVSYVVLWVLRAWQYWKMLLRMEQWWLLSSLVLH